MTSAGKSTGHGNTLSSSGRVFGGRGKEIRLLQKAAGPPGVLDLSHFADTAVVELSKEEKNGMLGWTHEPSAKVNGSSILRLQVEHAGLWKSC